MQALRRVTWIGIFLLVAIVALLFFTVSLQKSPPSSPCRAQEKTKQERLFQHLGYTFWQDMKSYSDHFDLGSVDLEAVIQGMRACERGGPVILNMAVQEERQMILDIQKELHAKTYAQNLQRAQEFLNNIAYEPSIFTIIDKKLYYEVLREGHGIAQVSPDSTCLLHYTITTLDDEIADTRKDNTPQWVCLAEIIPGFAQGVYGMKEGERRKIYIHPDLGYRKAYWKMPPEALLFVDVELCEQETKR